MNEKGGRRAQMKDLAGKRELNQQNFTVSQRMGIKEQLSEKGEGPGCPTKTRKKTLGTVQK